MAMFLTVTFIVYMTYQAIFICYQEELLPFEHSDNDEMNEIRLWDMQENIGYVDECDVKIVQMVCQR